MAQLSSPGVSVTVIDESFYSPAAPGTIPLIFVATEENKPNVSNTGVAPGTLKSNANKVYSITSQRDLIETFGTPVFKTDANNNPIHAGEQNEYGLQAAYSYLGVSNRAYVVRADVNLGELAADPTPPVGEPINGDWWFDVTNTKFGIFEWNAAPALSGGQNFTVKYPTVITDINKLVNHSTYGLMPKETIGSVGSYAICAYGVEKTLWYKKPTTSSKAGTWVLVGSEDWVASRPTVKSAKSVSGSTSLVGENFSINGRVIPAAADVNQLVNILNLYGPDGQGGYNHTFTTSAATFAVNPSILTNVEITGTGGEFSCSLVTNGTLAVGKPVQIAGGWDGTGSITNPSYANPTTYYIKTTNGTSTFTLVTNYDSAISGVGGEITTTVGTVLSTVTVGVDDGKSNVLHFSVMPPVGIEVPPPGATVTGPGIPMNSVVVSSTSNSITINNSVSVNVLSNATINVANTTDNGTGFIQGVSAAVVNNKFELYSTGESLFLTGSWYDVFEINNSSVAPYNAPALQISTHTLVPAWKLTQSTARPSGSIWIKTTSPNLGANWVIKNYNSVTNAWVTKPAPLYKSNSEALFGLNPTGGGINLTKDSVYVKCNSSESSPDIAKFKIYTRRTNGITTITSNILSYTGEISFKIQESVVGSATLLPTDPAVISVSFENSDSLARKAEKLALAINQATSLSNRDYVNVVATVTNDNKVLISHIQGGEIKFTDTIGFASIFEVKSSNNLTANENGNGYTASLWSAVEDYDANLEIVPASFDAPSTTTLDGKIWYDSIVDEVDILINTGSKWVGYQYPGDLIYNEQTEEYDQTPLNRSPYYNTDLTKTTDPNGPIVMSSEPSEQSDGTPLVDGDLWISTADLENYPLIYRYNINLSKWILLDNTDQTTEEGIIFHDARWTATGENVTDEASSIVELLSSAYVDFDAPDPVLYPEGMLLWNLRRSGFNVKKFVRNYVDINTENSRYEVSKPGVGIIQELQTNYYPHRWISIAANQENGAGTFGRKAQRRVVIQALQALVNSNQEIRDEEGLLFNLMSCPGYPELIEEMISLNYDRGLTAFVVGDTPARLLPDATSLNNWGNNANGAVENGDDGLVSFDEYMGVFYPWGYTSDNIGNNIVVPPSHMILRMISLSDNVSYPWFAPAGTRRGGITTASAVGYVDSEGEFRTVNLNTGQRDTMQNIKVNPITFISGTGLVNYGQYTRARNASALDRINVARLIVYLRRQLTVLARPYVFEPNDKITRDEFKGAIEGVMLGLVGQRALYDFIVVCDQSNNTPERIDRYELWADVAIEPVKAAEFIYIPLRLKNTGEISGMAR